MKLLPLILIASLMASCSEKETTAVEQEYEEPFYFCGTAQLWHSTPRVRLTNVPLNQLKSAGFSILDVTNNDGAALVHYQYKGECKESKMDLYIYDATSRTDTIELDARLILSKDPTCADDFVENKEVYDLTHLRRSHENKPIILHIQNWDKQVVLK
jgi:hypothetical protein